MRISVIGCGYLGAVHAAGLAAMGHDVVGIDTDPGKVELLRRGVAPFYEPGLPELLGGAGSGSLRFTTAPEEAADCVAHFVCVGTPQRAGFEHAADLSYVDAAIEALLPHLAPQALVPDEQQHRRVVPHR